MESSPSAPNFDSRKELVSGLTKGSEFFVDGNKYIFEELNNESYPWYIYSKNEAGEFAAISIADIEQGKSKFSVNGEEKGIQQKAEKKDFESELSDGVLEVVDKVRFNQDDYKYAFTILSSVSGGLPDGRVVERVAKMVRASVDYDAVRKEIGDKLDNGHWALAEALIQIEKSK